MVLSLGKMSSEISPYLAPMETIVLSRSLKPVSLMKLNGLKAKINRYF
jgi:hypothetical protein